MPAKHECKLSTKNVQIEFLHLILNNLIVIKMLVYLVRLKLSLTRKLTMLSIWIRWFCIQKLLLSVINNFKKTSCLNLNGLKNKRNLICWWKLRDLKDLKLPKSENLHVNRHAEKEPLLLSIRFKNVKLSALNKEKCYRKNRNKWLAKLKINV